MKAFLFPSIVTVMLSLSCCAPIETIVSHDFSSGYFKFKTPDTAPEKIYAEVNDDSVNVYMLKIGEGKKEPDSENIRGINIPEIKQGNKFYGSKFTKISADIDLSTILTKLRPSYSGVPAQLNTNLNAIIYVGARKDYYSIKTHTGLLKKSTSSLIHFGFDAGIFAGIGSTPVNFTTTLGGTIMEYDGIVFQKGIAAFITIEKISLGISLGFDNLLDKNAESWVYNQKPWIGLVLGIANF